MREPQQCYEFVAMKPPCAVDAARLPSRASQTRATHAFACASRRNDAQIKMSSAHRDAARAVAA